MFNIGDTVVYPMHGAGKIVGVDKKEVLGVEQEYYLISMPIGHMKLSVPVKKAKDVGMRYCISKEEGKKVKDVLCNEATDMPTNWNTRYRENQEALKTGDIYTIASVVRNLMHLDIEKGLSTGEKKMLNNAKRLIVSELVLVGAMTKEEAEKMIDDSIDLSEEGE